MAAKGKLLIVDDDPHIRWLVRIYLRDSPYEVFEAATGDEAVKKRSAAPHTPTCESFRRRSIGWCGRAPKT